MKIALILKDHINHRPPILSVVRHLIDLGNELILITIGIEEDTKRELEQHSCKCISLSSDDPLEKFSRLGHMVKWYLFRKRVFSILAKESYDVLWIGSADAMLALGKELWNYPYVLQIQELYDTIPLYRDRMGDYMRHARRVVVPEEVRAHTFRAWYQLKETPAVLPNKPFGHPRKRNMPITDPKAAEAFAKIPAGSKIVFHQGFVTERRNIKPIAKAIEELGYPWAFAVQCPMLDNEYSRDLFQNYKFYHIPFVPAPRHLEITSNVHFGLVTFMHTQLNTEFCAPNKIWEYSGFGLPMFANDVLGLINTVGKYRVGVCPNLETLDVEGIKDNLRILLEHEEEFSKNAAKLFDSVDNRAVISGILEDVAK